MTKQDVIIIGGGASGIFSALVAKEKNASVCLLERNPRVGKKILVTGNGRCNYTNVLATGEDYNNKAFVTETFRQFSPAMTVEYFQNLGIVPKVEELGKTFPLSEQASSIVDVFLYRLQTLGIEVVCDALVQDLKQKNHVFTVTLQDGSVYTADNVILATGGRAMPGSGSDGVGYNLAKKLGHTITPVFPSLVKLKLESPYLKSLDGCKISGRVQLIHHQSVIQEEEGDILFTDYGISGPTILQLSRKANELLAKNEAVSLKIILIHSLTRMDLMKRFALAKDVPLDFSLIGLIHKRLISPLLKEAGILKQNTLVSALTPGEIHRIIDLLFGWTIPVSGTKGFEDAQVTAGGIATAEINPATLESKKVPGLYFAGEIIDIDGRCGGYNLQWAWSSAYVAGTHAATKP
jgi:hypothetical protein